MTKFFQGDRDFIVSHFSTISVIATLSEEERQEVLTITSHLKSLNI
jgi:hypothetical protein